MIAITIDVDWAPDAVIADGLALLDALGARATVFATHRTPLLEGLDEERIEIALHPNYLPLVAGAEQDRRRPLRELQAIFPQARGIRTHGLVQSAALHQDWVDNGLDYESHQYFPGQLPPFLDFSGLCRIPVYWSDSREIYLPQPLEAQTMRYDATLPAVLVFHFVHLFLNTESGERYAAAKTDYQDPAALAAYRNAGPRKGARDFLREVVALHAPGGSGTVLCRELADACRAACGGRPASVMDTPPAPGVDGGDGGAS